MKSKKTEEWRSVFGFEGLYIVSSMGIIKSVDRFVKGKKNSKRLIKGKVIKTGKSNVGYILVALSKEGKGKTYSVHKIVARAFPDICGEWFEGAEINHLNEDKTDNRAINLRLCTRSENLRYGHRAEKASESLSKKVYQYTLGKKLIRVAKNAEEMAKITGFKKNSISNSCMGRRRKIGDYVFSYEDNWENIKNIEKYFMPNAMSKKVQCLLLDMTLEKEYSSIREIERETGFNKSLISLCCNGKIKTAYGRIWRFV